VNNANIAVQNVPNQQGTLTPLDATNNWWGMPTGATHDGFSAGDAVGQNILFAPHLPSMPFPCDLASADWIPFSEQELQFAINQNLPALRGIGFALLDMQWGYGAKFSLVSNPDYGSLAGEAFIRITPSPDGAFVTLTIDMSRLPTDPILSQIATCELMPLFLNSIGQVQHKLAPTVSDIDHIVPMESNLMVRFAPNAPEITPEPAPPLVMSYDTSCLPPAIPQPTPTPPPQNEGESLIQIPPVEGEFTLLETDTPQESQNIPLFINVDTDIEDTSYLKSVCTDDTPNNCSLHGAIEFARQKYPTTVVITIPNGTYWISEPLFVVGNMQLVASNYYQGLLQPGVMIKSMNPNTYLIGVDSHGLSDGMSHVSFYNIAIEDFQSTYHAFKITNSQVGIYNSRFSDIDHNGLGGGILWQDNLSGSPSDITIINTVFERNEGHVGGGIIAKDSTGSLRLECVTFEDNVANSRGGAIGTDYFDGTITILKSNFINNTVEQSGGGALYRMGGTISFEGTYWSPDYTDTPLAPNSVINAGAGDIVMGRTVLSPNYFNCFVPQPMRKVCLATTRTPSEGRGFGFWTKPQGEQGAIRSFSILPNEHVTVDATTGGWYRVRYNGQVGWVIDYALEKQDISCFIRLPLINSDGAPLEAIYDYDLELPRGEWLTEGEESKPEDWDTLDAKNWALTYCTGSSTITDNQNCAKVIYVVYYKIFKQIYGRVPRLSDILATTYQLELSKAPINIAEEALAGHYWAIHREYCEDMTRLRNITIADCPNYRIDIESFIVGYEKFGPPPADRNGGYLWTLQALYHQAVSIRDWYYGKENEPIPDRSGITDINDIVDNDRLPQLIPTVDNQVIGLRQLTIGKETSPLRQWGNHAYAFVDENLRNGYENGLGELDGSYVSDTIILHCHMNIYYYDPSNAGEDIFVVIIPPNLGDPSTYNMSPISPQWVGEYSYYYPNFSQVGKTYLRCDCLENGNRYPNDRRCLRPVGSNNP